jgi:hypothetical protein
VAAQATPAGFKVKVANLDSCVRAAKGGADVLPKNGAVVIVSSTYNGTPPDNASAFAKWLDEQQEGECGSFACAAVAGLNLVILLLCGVDGIIPTAAGNMAGGRVDKWMWSLPTQTGSAATTSTCQPPPFPVYGACSRGDR